MANEFKGHCKKAIPEHLRSTHYKLLLEMVDQRNIQNKSQLTSYLEKRTQELQSQLGATESSTKNDLRRQAAMELDMIKEITPLLSHL